MSPDTEDFIALELTAIRADLRVQKAKMDIVFKKLFAKKRDHFEESALINSAETSVDEDTLGF